MDNADCEELKQLRVTCKAFQSIRELGDDYRHERSPYASTQLGAMQSLRRNLPSSPDRMRMREIATVRVRYGYRKILVLLQREG